VEGAVDLTVGVLDIGAGIYSFGRNALRVRAPRGGGPKPPPALGRSYEAPVPARSTIVGGRAVGSFNQVGSHHIIQVSAVADIFRVTRGSSPAVDIGKSLRRGTPHWATRGPQRQIGGGTYAAERRIAYKALRKAGFSPKDARYLIEEVADPYFFSRGVKMDTPTRIPGDRR
jgi:hypothetical protein